MKKKYCKGFSLVETLVVCVFVAGVLIYIFIQFTAIQNSYKTSFTYNTVPGLYGASNINKYLINNETSAIQTTLIKQVETGEQKHSNLTDCSFASTNESASFCKELVKHLNIKNILLVKENLTDFREYIKTNHPYSASLETFIRRLDVTNVENQYRLIIEYKNGNCASIKLNYDNT